MSIDESYTLSRAYVPEHIPSLMGAISQAAPFLVEDYLGFAKDNWVIFVGYPLETQFDPSHCDELVALAIDTYKPEYLWFIGPEIPPRLAAKSQKHQSDQFLHLDLANWKIKASLQREVDQAARTLVVEQSRDFTPGHRSLVDELMDRGELPPVVAELYRSMPEYIAGCKTAHILNARDAAGQLAAFFVVECAADRFDTYVLGCFSRKNYIPHASDLLFAEMIAGARQRGKPGLNLGLGVNAGIRRFKMKWGGQPTLNYEFCECYFGLPPLLSALDMFLG